jgi:hypothetical protein
VSVGLGNAYGIEAGFDALHKIISERKKDEILKAKEEDDRREFEFRQQQAQQQAEQYRLTNERLIAATQAATDEKAQNNLEQEGARTIAAHTRGDLLTPHEAGTLTKLGQGPALVQTPNMPQTQEMLGSLGAVPGMLPSLAGKLQTYAGTAEQNRQAGADARAEQARKDAEARDARLGMQSDRMYGLAVDAGNRAAANQGKGDDARLDRSYNKEVSRMDSIAKPVLDRADRLQRLKISLDAQSPQADALIAPELLTAMAGGQGSGLRMNEAEIARIVGGRSKLESLKASLNQWSLDPSKALSITPDQRMQVRALVEKMSAKVDAKVAAVQRAHRGLIDAPDVNTQRNVSDALAKELSDIDTRDDAPGGPPPGVTVTKIEKVRP